jgi:hypothetical protein
MKTETEQKAADLAVFREFRRLRREGGPSDFAAAALLQEVGIAAIERGRAVEEALPPGPEAA